MTAVTVMNIFRRPLPFLLALLLMLSVGLQACTPAPPPDDFAYAAIPFTASVRGTYTPADQVPRPIAATVSVDAPITGGGPTGRSMTVTFTQPATLAGITVSSVCEADPRGKLTRTVTFTYPSAYGEVKVSSAEGNFDGLLRFAEVLLPRGDVAEVSPVAEDSTHTVTRRTADGMWEGVYLFSKEHPLPLRVTVTDSRRSETIELVVESPA